MDRLYGVKLYAPQFCNSRTIDLLQEAGFNTVYLGRDALVPAFTSILQSFTYARISCRKVVSR